jgi:hypothetical protein
MKLSEQLKESGADQAVIDAAIKTEEALEKANGEAKTYRLEKKGLKDQLSKFEGIDVDDYKNTKKQADELKRQQLEAQGKYEEALAEATKTLNAELDSMKGIISSKDSALSKALIDNAIITSIDGKAINNDQVLSLIRGNIKLEDNQVVVMEGESHRLNAKGERMQVDEYASSFLEENPHMMKAKGGGHGSNGSKGGSDGENTISREAFDGLQPAQQVEHFKNGGLVKD